MPSSGMKFDRFVGFIIFQQIRVILLYHRGKRFSEKSGIDSVVVYRYNELVA
jgi:hypothetical protein